MRWLYDVMNRPWSGVTLASAFETAANVGMAGRGKGRRKPRAVRCVKAMIGTCPMVSIRFHDTAAWPRVTEEGDDGV